MFYVFMMIPHLMLGIMYVKVLDVLATETYEIENLLRAWDVVVLPTVFGTIAADCARDIYCSASTVRYTRTGRAGSGVRTGSGELVDMSK